MDWAMVLDVVLKIFGAIGGCAVVGTMTPNSASHPAADAALRVFNWAGANVGRARNR